MLIKHALVRAPAGKIFIQIDTYNFVGSEKAVINALTQRVGVNRYAKVIDIRNLFGFSRGGGQSNLRRSRKVFKNFTPCGICCRAAAMAFVDHNQVKEVTAELLVDVAFLLCASDGLIQGEVYFIRLIGLPLLDFCHRRAKWLEVVGHGLID